MRPLAAVGLAALLVALAAMLPAGAQAPPGDPTQVTPAPQSPSPAGRGQAEVPPNAAPPNAVQPDDNDTIDVTKRRPPPRRRIIQGEAAPDNADDAVVAIQFINPATGGKALCTGTAISGNAIVTAGHCTCGRPGSYGVVIGATTTAGVRAAVESVVTYPGFDCNRPGDEQPGLDVGLIVLRDNIEVLARLTATVSLLGDLVVSRPTSLRVYGYGLTETGGLGQRRKAPIPVKSLTCTDVVSKRAGCHAFYEFVLAATTASSGGIGRDSCGGDSGGPVFWEPASGQRYLVGVVSRGLRNGPTINGQPCGGGGVYSVIGRHTVIGWLRKANVTVCVRGEDCEAQLAQPPSAAAEVAVPRQAALTPAWPVTDPSTIQQPAIVNAPLQAQ